MTERCDIKPVCHSSSIEEDLIPAAGCGKLHWRVGEESRSTFAWATKGLPESHGLGEEGASVPPVGLAEEVGRHTQSSSTNSGGHPLGMSSHGPSGAKMKVVNWVVNASRS